MNIGCKEGPDALTVTRICKELNCDRRVIYNRFRDVDELKKMNADISVDGRTATIVGPAHLTGAPVKAVDLRGGAALVIAGLAAKGKTEICNVEYIERGYDNIVGKLRGIGADISLVDIPDAVVEKAN